MNELPNTIHSPKLFEESQWHIQCPQCGFIIGYDGACHWNWILEAIGQTKKQTNITPMDVDGGIERHLHYLMLETKNPGIEIPSGQRRFLENLPNAKSFTIMHVWGKQEPIFWEAQFTWRNKRTYFFEGNGVETAKDFVRRWFKFANKKQK